MAVAGIGVLASVGGGVLSGIIVEALDRAQSKEKPQATAATELEDAIAAEVSRMLAADNADAPALRTEIAAVLKAVDAGGVLMQAAIEQDRERDRRDIISATGVIGAGVAEMDFLLREVAQAAAVIQESLDAQGVDVRVIIEQNRR